MVAAAAGQQQAGEGRPAMNVPRHVLDAFSGLVSGEERKRAAAGMVVLQHVDLVLRGGVQGKELPAGVRYILQRLVSGLASTRFSAREGYYSTLCLILRLHPSSLKPAYILSLLTSKKSATMKALTKDEIKDQLMAELLLCGAIVRSGQVRRAPELLQCVVNQLCALRAKKSYLDITATQFLVSLMEGCEGGIMHEEVLQSLQAELQGPVADLSPSQLWLRLVLLRKHRKDPPVWLTSTLTPKNHEALGQTIMKAVIGLPEVHPVLSELVSNLAASSSALLVKFWGVTLEPLQAHATPGKLQILFHLLKFIIPHLRTAAEFKAVVTPSVVGLLLSSLTQSLRDLKEAARGVTAALVQLVKDHQDEESNLQLVVVQALITQPGSVRFDQLGGHKVLAVMMPSFTLSTLKGFASILLEVLNKPKVAKDSGVPDRNYAAHTLCNLLGQPRACATEAGEWQKQQLAAFLKAALLTPRNEEEREGDAIKDAFFKVLGKHLGHIKEYKITLLSLVEEVEKELRVAEKADAGDGPSPTILGVKGRQQWSKVYSRLARLKKDYKEDTEEDIAKTIFQVLYCQMALHLFVDVTVATESIDEFITCHKEVKKLGMFSDDAEEEEEEEEDDKEEEGVEGKPNWVEVVTEMFLTLMTQETHLFRSVVQGLFWLLNPLMTAVALSLLTDVLDTDKARELLKKEGEESEDEDEDEEDEDEDEEEEDDDEEDKEGKKEEKDGEDSDSDEEEEEEGPGEDDDPNLFTLRKKMLSAAGGLDVDVDMDSVPQEELDRMDERLGALLAEYRGKQRRKRKKKGGSGDDGPQLTPDELSLMHFQTRVCDMLMVYIKVAPNMTLQVGLVIPLIKALRVAEFDARQKDLQNKLANVISALEKKKKFDTLGDLTTKSWKKIVNEFFSIACQMPDRFVSVIQSCYSQLMHCGHLLLGKVEGAAMKPDNFLTLTYVSHLKTFFTQNSHQLTKVQPFTEPCTYNMGGLWQVAAILLQAAFDPTLKVHIQSQGLRTLQQLYTNKTLVAERSREEVAALERDLYSRVMETLDSMQPPFSGHYAACFFNLLRSILQAERRSESELRLDWGAVQERVKAFRERITRKDLKVFRKEYNMLSEALRGLLSKKGQMKQELKRVAKETNKEGSQASQMEVNEEDRTNSSSSLVNSTTVLEEVEEEKKSKKKKKKNKQVPHEEETIKVKDIEETDSQDTVKIDEISDDEIMVINGNNNEIEYLGEVNVEEAKTKKKKKKKDKHANTIATTEDTTETPDQEVIPKKKKKKKKDKLTETAAIITASASDSPQKEDNLSEERKEGSKKKKKKDKQKDKLADAVIIDSITISESQDTQSEEILEEVTVIKKKKKKDKLRDKRKQKDEGEEEKAANGGEQQIGPPSSSLTPEPPTKKKKKKHIRQENGDL